MFLDVSVLYHDQQYRTAGKPVGLERYSGTGYVFELRPDGSGSALLCGSRVSGDDRKAQYNVAASWAEPLTLAQAIQMRLILEKIQPQDAGQMEIALPIQKTEDVSVSMELLAAVLEAIFTNSCLILDRSGAYGEEDVCAVLQHLPRPHCTLTVGFSPPAQADLCTITITDAPVTSCSGKRILRMGDISNRYLPMAKVIGEAEWPIRQYALEQNTFVLYASLAAMGEEGTVPNQTQFGELVNAWEVLPPAMQKQILRRLVDQVGQKPNPTRREMKPASLYRRIKRPKFWRVMIISAFALWLYLAANLSVLLFAVVFVLMWFYWSNR